MVAPDEALHAYGIRVRMVPPCEVRIAAARGHLVTGVLMCLTVIGIPLGLANFKLIPVAITPFGREIVDIEQARRLGLAAGVAMPADRSRGS